MPPLLIWSLVLLAALAALIKGADIFVEQSAKVARVLGAPDVIIGVTLVALGTSLPELAASMASALSGAGEFAAGTVVGSNTANILFILGAAALAFRGFSFSLSLLSFDLPIMILVALVISLMLHGGAVDWPEGLILLAMYGIYLFMVAGRQADEALPTEGKFKLSMIVWLVVGGAAVWLGADYTVTSAVKLTELLGLGDTALLAITVVAVGSSLPELVVTLTAARKRYHDLSVGNVVGSNICNSTLVLGAPALVRPVPTSPVVDGVGIPFMLAASLIIYVLAQRGEVGRHAGLMMLLVFALYLGKIVGAF